jgi:hypothetical protein
MAQVKSSKARPNNGHVIMSPVAVDVPELLTTVEVAALLRVDRSTLSRWRSSGCGPRVTWLSPTIPRYQRTDVVEWLRQVAA